MTLFTHGFAIFPNSKKLSKIASTCIKLFLGTVKEVDKKCTFTFSKTLFLQKNGLQYFVCFGEFHMNDRVAFCKNVSWNLDSLIGSNCSANHIRVTPIWK